MNDYSGSVVRKRKRNEMNKLQAKKKLLTILRRTLLNIGFCMKKANL